MDTGEICERLTKLTGKRWGFLSEDDFVSYDGELPIPMSQCEKYDRKQVIELLEKLENNELNI